MEQGLTTTTFRNILPFVIVLAYREFAVKDIKLTKTNFLSLQANSRECLVSDVFFNLSQRRPTILENKIFQVAVNFTTFTIP